MSFSLPEPPKIKVYLIGDSTMCLYKGKQLPLTGWGMPFADYFDSGVSIDNCARGGRSTKTFVAENRWRPIADSLKEGDYVMIQFGHNDEAKTPQHPERYTPVPDYKNYLVGFINDARKKKANPILITPVSRRSFDKDGKALETHVEYSKAVLEVGEQYHVAVIDLDRKSRELFQQLGLVKTQMLFMDLDTAEHPNYPLGRKDNTHFNETGARMLAQIILNDLKEKKIALADHIVKGNNKPTVNPQAK